MIHAPSWNSGARVERARVSCHGYFAAFRTPVRAKHKARDCVMAVPMAKERNAVIGAHRRSRQNGFKSGARLHAPVDCVAPLDKGITLASAPRLATHARSLAEYGKIPVTGHYP